MPRTARRGSFWRGSGLFFGLLAAASGVACGAPRPAVTEVHVADAPVAEAPSAAATATEEPEPVAPKPRSRPRSAPVAEASPVGLTPGDVTRAKELFKLGTAAYGSGDYANAKLNWEAAYAITPENALLFNIASAELKMGQTSAACAHFRKYVANGDPSDPRTQQVSQQTAQRCP